MDFLLELAKFYNISCDYMIGLSNSRLPSDILNSMVVDEVSYQCVIEKIQKLSIERKRNLLAILDDLYRCSVIQESNTLPDRKESKKQ